MKWLARGEAGLPAGESWLSPAETARTAGMRFTKRRTEFLVARWAAKEAIGRLAGPGVAPARVEVRHHVTGAPEAYLDGRPLDLAISLTDRADWAVCLLSREPGRVGCDLELVEPRSDAFVRDWFTPAERRLIADAGGDLAANLLWSAKESALKVLRTGLRRDTRSVEVTADLSAGVTRGVTARSGSAGWAPLVVRTAEGGVFPGWWQRFGDFLLTVAADRPLPPPEPLEDPSPLAAAVPSHGWLAHPVSPAVPPSSAMPRSRASTT